MFTVKQIVNNATSIYETEGIVIAKPGSEQWSQAMSLAQELGCHTPDLIEFVPAVYADPEGKDVITEEEKYLSVPRDNVYPYDCVAIILTQSPSPVAPEIPEMGGVAYQFIYSGDQVYVMNSTGATIETVRTLKVKNPMDNHYFAEQLNAHKANRVFDYSKIAKELGVIYFDEALSKLRSGEFEAIRCDDGDQELDHMTFIARVKEYGDKMWLCVYNVNSSEIVHVSGMWVYPSMISIPCFKEMVLNDKLRDQLNNGVNYLNNFVRDNRREASEMPGCFLPVSLPL